MLGRSGRVFNFATGIVPECPNSRGVFFFRKQRTDEHSNTRTANAEVKKYGCAPAITERRFQLASVSSLSREQQQMLRAYPNNSGFAGFQGPMNVAGSVLAKKQARPRPRPTPPPVPPLRPQSSRTRLSFTTVSRNKGVQLDFDQSSLFGAHPAPTG